MALKLCAHFKRLSPIKMILLSLVLFMFVMILLYQFEAPILFGSEIFMQNAIYLHVISSQSTPSPSPIATLPSSTKTIPNVDSESKMPSPVHPKATVLPPSTARPLYSSFVCLGGDTNYKINNYRKTFGSLLQHTCHFKNICYSNTRDKWLYFSSSTPSAVFQEIIQSEQDVMHYDFNTTNRGFLMMHSMKSISIEPEVVHYPFPNLSDIHLYFNKPVVFHYLQWIYNFGHVLTDNYYSMWRALHYFHLYRNNSCCQPLFKYSWTAAGFEKGPLFLPRKFIDGLNDYIFNGTKPIFLGFDSQRNRGRDPEVEMYYDRLFAFNDTVNDLACFKDIVLGTDDFRIWWKAIMRKFYHRWDFGIFIDLFRKHPLHIERFNHFMNVKEQKILLISKGENERRHWTNDTNITYIVEYLEGLFGVDIDAMYAEDIYNGKSLTEQIDFILPYTLVITACGAVSYIGAFMRSGTAMITVDYWHSHDNASSHIDSYLWEYLPDRKTYYYYVRGDEYEMPNGYNIEAHLKNAGRLPKEDVRNEADYRLKASRLSNYVYSALMWIEHYNGWTDTFTRPPLFPIDQID